jgi:hypothetical protein
MVMLLYGSEPRGITAISGFQSEAECKIKGELLDGEQSIFREPSQMHLYSWCAEGSLK